MRYITAVFLLCMWALPHMILAAPIDFVDSRVFAEKTTLQADGIDNTIIIVTVRDLNFSAIPDQVVTLSSSRGAQDTIRAEHDRTDVLGKAYFRVSSLRNGTSIYTATIQGVAFTRTAAVTYWGGLTHALAVGDLIKIPDDGDAKTLNDTAVYYYASNGRRYVFPNEKVYFTWYQNFSKVKIIPLDQMSLIPIGGNVTYKPGSKLVKFQTDTKTYLVTKGGVLRWAKTEDVARAWFGPQWNQAVDDISEAFYVNYIFGRPVENALDLAIDVVRGTVNTIDDDKGLED